MELNQIKLNDLSKAITALQNINRYISYIIMWSTIILTIILMKYANTFPDDSIPKDIVLVSTLLFTVVMLVFVFSDLVNRFSFDNMLNIGLVLLSVLTLSAFIPFIGFEYDSGNMLMVTIWEIYSHLISYYLAYLLSFGVLKCICDYLISKNGATT